MGDTIFKHRLAGEADMPFIFSSWLKSFRLSHYAGVLPMNQYYDAYRAAIEALLKRPGVELWVATNPEESDAKHEIYGWCCIERGARLPIVHYIYLKQSYRSYPDPKTHRIVRMGLARALLAAVGVDVSRPFAFTYKTPKAATILRARHLPGEHDPLAARYPRAERQADDRDEG